MKISKRYTVIESTPEETYHEVGDSVTLSLLVEELQLLSDIVSGKRSIMEGTLHNSTKDETIMLECLQSFFSDVLKDIKKETEEDHG